MRCLEHNAVRYSTAPREPRYAERDLFSRHDARRTAWLDPRRTTSGTARSRKLPAHGHQGAEQAAVRTAGGTGFKWPANGSNGKETVGRVASLFPYVTSNQNQLKNWDKIPNRTHVE